MPAKFAEVLVDIKMLADAAMAAATAPNAEEQQQQQQ